MRLDAWNASGEMNEATRKSAREELSSPDSVPSSISDPGMELGLNSWLPAYGFHASQMQLQIQTAPHHLSNFQPLSLQEDNRSTDGLLVQQVEFLETIFEETSDDLQSDSDRSGTTYWVGSDSETESVIHIRAPFADEKHDGSGSDCNSVVPKKRRRKNGVREEDDAMTMFADNEDESSSSSRSSSLLQFESLERNCAIGGCRDSPSSYSFDSLEFASRSAANGGGGGGGGGGGSGGNPSPDSLESFDECTTSSRPRYGGANGVAKIRPYRSFESLEVCQIRDDAGRRSNGVESTRRGIGPRSFVESSSVWDDYDVDDDGEEEEEEEEYDEEEDFDDFEGFDEDVRASTTECRNVIDLREIGIETKRDFVSELRSGQAIAPQSSLQSRLNIATNAGRGCGCDSSQQGWSESSFNFRFTDKSRSVPSLVSDARTNGSPVPSRRHTLPPESLLFGSSSQDFQDFHRVCSCPVGLNLCGATEPSDAAAEPLRDSRTGPKMAESDATATPEARAPTVRTQDRTETSVLVVPVPMDAGADVDSIVDEAVRQFEREVAASGGGVETSRPRRVKNNASYELAQQFEVRGNLDNGSQQHPEPPRRFRVKNNASYELAQQYDFVRALGGPNFRSFRRMDACDELEEPGTSATTSRNGSRLKVTDLVEEMDRSYAATSANDLTALRTANRPSDDARVYSKSNEDVRRPANGIARQPRNDAEPVVSRIKKNSDLFSTSGKSGSDESVDDATVKPSSEPLDDHHQPPSPSPPPPPHHHYRQRHPSSQTQRHESRDALPPDRLPPREPQTPSHEVQLSPYEPQLPPPELLAATSRGGGGGSTLDEGYAERNGVLAASDEGYGAGGGATDSESRQRARASLNSTEYSEARAGSTSATNVYATESAASTREASRAHGSTPNLRGMSLLGELYPERVAREGATFDDDPFLDDVDEGIGSVKDYERDGGCFRGSVRSESAIGSRRRVGDGPRSDSSTTSGNTSLLGDGSTSSVWATSCRPEADAAYPLHDRCVESFQREASLKRGGTVEGKQTSAANSPGSPGSELPTMSSGMISSSSPTPKTTTTGEKKKGGLGGFLQRFSKLRFSGRSKVPRSELLSNKKSGTNTGKVQQPRRDSGNNAPDYVIIPLHGPSANDEEGDRQTLRPQEPSGSSTNLERTGSNVSSNSRSTGISSKPPLPPQLTPRSGAQAGARSSSGAATRRRAATDLGSSTGIEMAKARAMQAAFERPVGLLETDLDAADVVAASRDTRQVAAAGVAPGAATASPANKKTRSLLNLNQNRGGTGVGVGNALRAPESPGGGGATEGDVVAAHQRPHKSMEFLLDKENLHFVAPPENELQKVGERVPSEHELRVQRSLQRLNVPDWYKNSPAARDGFRLKRHSDASQHGGGWRALGSKTTSLSSLSSPNKPATGPLLLSPSPTPPVFSRWSTSLLNSAGSSPASSARSSFNHRQPYLGWRSQERLSNPRTPAERLAQGILPNVPPTSKRVSSQQATCFGPAQQLEVRNSIKEVTSAIVHYVQSGQEVNHGGRLSPRPDDWDDGGSARSTSPRGSVKLCWMESSFVGTRPVDSPETPMSLTTDADCCVVCNSTATESCTCVDSAASGLFLDLTPENDHRMSRSLSSQCQRCHRRGSGSVHSETEEAMAAAALLRNKPSPGSTTLEDVLDSLLGLPPASRTPSPGPGPTRRSTAAGKSCSTLRQDLQESANAPPDANHVGGDGSFYAGGLTRRKSEGSDTIPQRHGAKPSSSSRNRRVSFDNAQDSSLGVNLLQQEKTVRCRYSKCGASATAAEARRTFKSCHNCSYTYCSRECRRAHWERHRRTCLHSRAGTLCRQVLSSAKEDGATLRHISTLAHRGYASHGRGAVKCFFGSPEAAEKFITNGFIDLGEPTYARWSDLLPGEMGTELYSELMRLCKSYNPETRLVLYVAVCVVSEVPTTGAVRWERQLVSRCAKIRLANSCREAIPAPPPSSQLRPSTSPCNITREMDSPETLVLTSFPGNNGQNTPQRAREISFTNIQRQLRLRGVSLRRHFPQVYKKLCSYVDGSVDKFAPVTIYPRDHASGKSFMCIIMLDAEPERLQLLPTDSSRVRTVDISIEQE